jgi:hypothetical protein
VSKGFSINGWVFLLGLLSLFAGFYYLGGIRGRNEVRSLSPELQAAQQELKQAQVQYQFMSALKDSVIVQMKFVVDNSLAQVEQYKGICEEAVKREAAAREELGRFNSITSPRWWTNPRYLEPWDGVDHMGPCLDTIIGDDCATFLPLR